MAEQIIDANGVNPGEEGYVETFLYLCIQYLVIGVGQ